MALSSVEPHRDSGRSPSRRIEALAQLVEESVGGGGAIRPPTKPWARPQAPQPHPTGLEGTLFTPFVARFFGQNSGRRPQGERFS